MDLTRNAAFADIGLVNYYGLAILYRSNYTVRRIQLPIKSLIFEALVYLKNLVAISMVSVIKYRQAVEQSVMNFFL